MKTRASLIVMLFQEMFKISMQALLCYKAYLDWLESSVMPFLKALWYLRIPIFSAMLSFIFFAAIPQTLEVYRAFALDLSEAIWPIILSYVSIFLLSLSIWYAGRALSKKKEEEKEIEKGEKERKERENAMAMDSAISLEENVWTWTPRLFGVFPLIGLGFGLIETIDKTTDIGWRALTIYLIFFAISLLPIWLIFLKKATIKLGSKFATILSLTTVGIGEAWVIQKIEELSNGLSRGDSPLLLGVLFAACLAWFFLVSVMNRKDIATRFPEKISSITTEYSEKISAATTKFPEKISTVITKYSEKIFGGKNLFGLFGSDFLLILSFLSILIFTILSFPLLSTNEIKCVVIALVLIFLLFASWLFSESSNWYFIFFLLILSAILLILTAFKFPPLASRVGPVTILSAFLIVFTTWSSAIFYQGYKLKFPLIGIMLLLAVGLSFLDKNDNHRLREMPSSELEHSIPTLEAGFKTWIEARKDHIKEFKDQDAGKPYPIYIVSAQGGGIFAAYHSALTLSGMQDLCPAFASHVFAISGVSGGSIGATVFSSLVNADSPELENKPCGPSFSYPPGMEGQKSESPLGNLATKADSLLDQDLLSPLLAAGLFPDFVQRFLPSISNLSESIDRARGIEYAFESAWKETKENQKNPLENSFYTHWDPAKAAPALVLNTTVVETGSRLVISPFKIDFPSLKDIRTIACKTGSDEYEKDIDLPLSTAAFLSARFPLVTPVAWFYRCDNPDKMNQKARLADGGYFENSGVSTAFDLGSRLEEFLKQEEFLESISKETGIDITPDSFRVIYLAITSQPSRTIPKAKGFNEIRSPLGALWNSREARGLDLVNRVEHLKNSTNSSHDSGVNTNSSRFELKYINHQFRQFFLYDGSPDSIVQTKPFELPLGWLLSDFSEQLIQNYIGYRRNEEIDSNHKKVCPDELGLYSNNLCVIRSISEELSPLDQ